MVRAGASPLTQTQGHPEESRLDLADYTADGGGVQGLEVSEQQSLGRKQAVGRQLGGDVGKRGGAWVYL